ncbi:unnamed protein product [Amoebophrya sp. A25]|nr:unnamed protein product [Amoebophrya sp. A25]|eukprot:GSA25T00024058001.1
MTTNRCDRKSKLILGSDAETLFRQECWEPRSSPSGSDSFSAAHEEGPTWRTLLDERIRATWRTQPRYLVWMEDKFEQVQHCCQLKGAQFPQYQLHGDLGFSGTTTTPVEAKERSRALTSSSSSSTSQDLECAQQYFEGVLRSAASPNNHVGACLLHLPTWLIGTREEHEQDRHVLGPSRSASEKANSTVTGLGDKAKVRDFIDRMLDLFCVDDVHENNCSEWNQRADGRSPIEIGDQSAYTLSTERQHQREAARRIFARGFVIKPRNGHDSLGVSVFDQKMLSSLTQGRTKPSAYRKRLLNKIYQAVSTACSPPNPKSWQRECWQLSQVPTGAVLQPLYISCPSISLSSLVGDGAASSTSSTSSSRRQHVVWETTKTDDAGEMRTASAFEEREPERPEPNCSQGNDEPAPSVASASAGSKATKRPGEGSSSTTSTGTCSSSASSSKEEPIEVKVHTIGGKTVGATLKDWTDEMWVDERGCIHVWSDESWAKYARTGRKRRILDVADLRNALLTKPSGQQVLWSDSNLHQADTKGDANNSGEGPQDHVEPQQQHQTNYSTLVRRVLLLARELSKHWSWMCLVSESISRGETLLTEEGVEQVPGEAAVFFSSRRTNNSPSCSNTSSNIGRGHAFLSNKRRALCKTDQADQVLVEECRLDWLLGDAYWGPRLGEITYQGAAFATHSLQSRYMAQKLLTFLDKSLLVPLLRDESTSLTTTPPKKDREATNGGHTINCRQEMKSRLSTSLKTAGCHDLEEHDLLPTS